MKLPWEMLQHYSAVLSDGEDENTDDEEEREAYKDQLQRLTVLSL